MLAAVGAAVVSHMKSKDVTREAIAVEVHGGCDFRPGKTNVPGPFGDVVVGGIPDVACPCQCAA